MWQQRQQADSSNGILLIVVYLRRSVVIYWIQASRMTAELDLQADAKAHRAGW